MSSSLLREIAVDIPSIGLDLKPGGRTVRAFFKGPSAGIDANTGILVNLHGIGGRQNDISYKIARKEIADTFNLVTVGVNYLGTDAYQQDAEFINRQLIGARNAMQAQSPELLRDIIARKKTAWLPPPKSFFVCCERAALEVAKPFPEDFWDFGYYQAVDVLSALHWLWQSLGPSHPALFTRIHLVSQSAGGQVGMMCLKLAPRTFSSLLDFGGALICGETLGGLRKALTDPFGGLHEQHIPTATGDLDGGGFIKMVRKNPVPFVGQATHSGAPFEDEIAIRDIGNVQHLSRAERAPSAVHMFRGCDDNFFHAEQKCALVDQLAGAGLAPRLFTITQDTIAHFGPDLFASTRHTLVKDLKGLTLRFGPELWGAHSVFHTDQRDIGSDASYAFATPGGTWTMRFLPAPLIVFTPNHA